MRRGLVQAVRQQVARVAAVPPPGRSITTLLPSSEVVPRGSGGGFLSLCRRFASSSGPSNICLIKSKEDFDGALTRVRDESSPAVLYFTAAWCGPCRLISPVIEELNQKYPHVTTYKVDIDQEGIQGKLMELGINSVPTLHFFQDGKKVEEIVGADVHGLRSVMEEHYSST
ncbi:hypothetical protein MLD38_027707 [Melastoma candidum]|uniref:Uncharacterized protein n=1 Tax=Melastoma candidum TaxID=119954 RepID=A0ACB9P3U9_9MYRT|nr:hypothetical protein MLD38_027707 [Melastoma candidum]